MQVEPRQAVKQRSSTPTSTSLLEAAKQHDQAAWQHLVELYGPLVFHWCRRAGLSPDNAADVLQEVFGAVARGLDRFEASGRSGSFRGWLVTITTNKVRDFARRRAKQPHAVGGSDNQVFLAQVPEDFDSGESRMEGNAIVMHRALDLVSLEFEQRTWKAFWQTAIESRPTNEVGRELGMTPVAVRKAKSRVLRRLREVLGEEEQ